MTTLTFDELLAKIPFMSQEDRNEINRDLEEVEEEDKYAFRNKPRKRKYRAVIQTNLNTGVHRVFFKKVINGEVKVVEKTKPTGSYKVTGYPSLSNVTVRLRGVIPVFYDEQIEWNGQNCELTLFNTGEEEAA